MKFIVALLIVIASIVPSIGLRCIECYYASDPSICKNTKDCGNNEQCYIREYISEENLRVYDLNCISDSICKSQKYGSGPPVVGKKKRSISGISNEQMKCCDTDLCNKHLFDQSTTTLQTTLGADLSSTTVTTELTSSAANSCTDQHVCKELAKSSNICSIPIISTKLCPLSCSMCGVMTSSTLPVSTNTSCSDHSDCKSLSQYVNICQDLDIASKLCPDYCKLCNASTTVTGTPLTGSCLDRDPSLCQYLENAFHICNNETHIYTLQCNETCGTCKGSKTVATKRTTIHLTTQPSNQMTDSTSQYMSPITSGVTETTTISGVTESTTSTSEQSTILSIYATSAARQSAASSTVTSGSSSCPPFPKDCPKGCATFGINFCWICDLTLCTGPSVKSTTGVSFVGITTTRKGFVVPVITPPVTTQRLVTSPISPRHLVTTTSGSAGCPVFPNTCPVQCTTYDNNFCQICDYNLCKGVTPNQLKCRDVFCVLNCGSPPVYKKDNNGCPICECAQIQTN